MAINLSSYGLLVLSLAWEILGEFFLKSQDFLENIRKG